jgi:hypothetical protein
VNAGNECFWTNLKWTFQVNELSNRLRFTILSKSILIGTIDFKLQQLIDATTEDQFMKRVRYLSLNDLFSLISHFSFLIFCRSQGIY